MTESEAKQLANDLIENWSFGTDILDHISDDMIQDLREKAALMFLPLQKSE